VYPISQTILSPGQAWRCLLEAWLSSLKPFFRRDWDGDVELAFRLCVVDACYDKPVKQGSHSGGRGLPAAVQLGITALGFIGVVSDYLAAATQRPNSVLHLILRTSIKLVYFKLYNTFSLELGSFFFSF
jgi:hypothetical protein